MATCLAEGADQKERGDRQTTGEMRKAETKFAFKPRFTGHLVRCLQNGSISSIRAAVAPISRDRVLASQLRVSDRGRSTQTKARKIYGLFGLFPLS